MGSCIAFIRRRIFWVWLYQVGCDARGMFTKGREMYTGYLREKVKMWSF